MQFLIDPLIPYAVKVYGNGDKQIGVLYVGGEFKAHAGAELWPKDMAAILAVMNNPEIIQSLKKDEVK